MSKNRLTLVCSILLLSALLLPTFAVTQEEPVAITVYSLQGDKQQTYIIPWSVLDAGGKVEEATSANYRLKDAIGQAVIGKCENANYRLYVGFLAAPEYVEKAFPVEEITIGDGANLCYNFAIFADPQVGEGGGDISYLTAAVDEIINRNSNVPTDDDIRFVIVLGDLIQGERIPGTFPTEWKGEGADNIFTSYRGEYYTVQQELERMERDAAIPSINFHYIPVTGNHDVWCKFPLDLSGNTKNGYWHDNSFPDYPEELFAHYFDAQYDELSQDLAGWTDQRVSMPIPNNYPGTQHPLNIYFENFAFDYGPYHFICLDFNARNDFDPLGTGLIPPLKKFFGYADLHDEYTSGNPITDGTWDWLNKHLDECERRGIKDVIIFTHEPPIFKLEMTGTDVATLDTDPLSYIQTASSTDIKAEMHIVDDPNPNSPLTGKTLSNIHTGGIYESWDNQKIYDGTTVKWVEGDAVYAFNNVNYDGQNEYGRLVNLFSTPDINIVRWFSGHYHLKGFTKWKDTNINAKISVIPSVMKAEDIYGIEFPAGTQVRLNDIPGTNAIVTPTKNPEGSIAIVHVMVDDTGPDLSIYSQWDPDVPDPKMWDNPDIKLYQNPALGPNFWGPFIDSHLLNTNTDYGVEVRVYNKGCSDANNVEVKLVWADYGAGNPPPEEHSTGIEVWDGSTWTTDNVAYINLPSGAEGKVYFKWKSGGTVGDHYCLIAKLAHPSDINPDNNKGQENTNVCGTKGGTTKEIHIPVGNPMDRPLHPQIEIIQHVKPGEANWSFMEVYIPEELPPYGNDTVVFNVSPPPDTHGESREFSINLRDETGFLLGGVMMRVVSDTPPTLEWVGTPCYRDDGVEPDSGIANTLFTYKVKYTDDDDDPPASGYPLLYVFKGDKQIQGSPLAMNEEDLSDTDYTDGKIYTCSFALPELGNDYTYFFGARDNLGVPAEGPATQIKEGPIVKEVPTPPTSLKEFFVTGDPDGNVYIYRSNNEGTFIRSNIGDVTNSGATPGSCAGAAIADYDHDGDLDVFMGNIDTGAIYLFTNIGSGNFAPPILCTTIPAPLGMDATIADFDNNGDYDYIAVGSNRRDIYIVPNIAAGGPNPTLIWTCRSGHVIDGVDAGDFNEDGNMDFLAVEYWTGSDNEVRLFEGNGDGTFKNPVVAFTAPSAATDGLPAVAVGDFNRDGHLDAIYGHDDGGDPGQAWLYLGDGNSNFAYRGDAYDVNPAESGADQPGGGLIDAFDFNKDGYLDIVATCCWSGPADDPVKGVYYIPENTPPLPPYFNDPTGPMDPSSIAKRMHAIAAPPLDGRWLVNPGWKIFLNSAGYSDILYCTPPAPYIEYEILSGEWAAALKYDDITNTGLDPTNPFGAQWLTQEFIYPGWPTGSPFKVIEPIRTWDNPYNPIDGPDAGHSAIANDRVRIDIEYSMVETSEGTPMGMSPDPESGSFVMSSKHVMLQRYTIKNIGDQTLNNFKFFQFLHAHPKGTWCPEILYDSERYLPGRPFAGYHYDITLWRQFGSGSHPEATECIGFSSDERPDYFGLGGYDDHDPGKPDIGLHWHIESADELPGNTHLSDLPAQNRLAGAEGWVLGRLEPNEQVSVRTLLAIHNPRLGAAPDYVDPWKDINEELDELIKKVKAATMPSTIKQSLVDRLEHAKTLMENAKTAHEAGNDAQAKNYLGVAKSQVGFFESMVKIIRRISETDKKEFLRESSKIIEKIDTLIESL